MYRQQNRFFKENKYDEKFQRRIDFLNANYAEVIRDLKLPIEKYNIKPYMCVNKVFVSRYKKIALALMSLVDNNAEENLILSVMDDIRLNLVCHQYEDSSEFLDRFKSEKYNMVNSLSDEEK